MNAATNNLLPVENLATHAVNGNGAYDLPVGTVLVVKGHPTKSENGRFVVVSSFTSGQSFWKRVKRNNEWSKGGNTARNFKGQSRETLNAWIAQGIASIVGAVDADYAQDCH